jgi:hypothetical protein
MRVPSFKTTAGLLTAVGALLGAATPALALSTPTLASIASPPVVVGGAITDTALVAGGSTPTQPTGTITFKIYGPTDTKCTGTPVFTSPAVALNVPTVSPPYTPTAPGTYQVIAAYSGDTNNAAVTGTCGTIGESTIVTPATPTVRTAASPSVGIGGALSDTAVLNGAYKPTGTLTFKAYGPGDTGCANPVFGSTEPAGVSTVSAVFRPTTAGVYRWVATYSGDTNNLGVAGSCADPAEAVTVTTAGAPGPGSQQPACTTAVAQAMASSLVAELASALTGGPSGAFKTTCSSGLRIVLRAKEIRPGNRGSPRHNGYTTIANTLTHSTPDGQIAFSLNAQGVALRAYAHSKGRPLTVFAIVHVRPDRTLVSSEAVQILTLT